MDKNPHLPGSADDYIKANMGLAHSIAWKFFNASKDRDIDDLRGIAYHGLVKSYQRFDPTNRLGIDDKPIKFSTYAGSMITGYLMTYIRQTDRPIHLGCRGINLIAKINAAGLNGNETIQEIADKAGISFDDAKEAVLASIAVNTDSIDREINTEDGSLHLADMLGSNDESNEDQEVIRDLMSELPEQLREVCRLCVVEGMTQRKAAEIMGISQSYLSRLKTKLMRIAKQYGQRERDRIDHGYAGPIKNEEEKKMLSIEQRENKFKLQQEVTTTEQFNEIGSPADVARLYGVNYGTAFGLKKKLAGQEIDTILSHPSETETVTHDDDSCEDDSWGENVILQGTNAPIETPTPTQTIDDMEIEVKIKPEWTEPITNEPDFIEEKWSYIQQSISKLRKAHMDKAAKEFDERLEEMMRGLAV